MSAREAATFELIDRGPVLRARLVGEIDLSNAAEVETTIVGTMPNEAHGLVLDLTKLTYLDSAGIRMLLTLVGRFSWRGQQMAIVAPEGSRVRKVLQLAGAGGALVVDADEDAAIARILHPDGSPPVG